MWFQKKSKPVPVADITLPAGICVRTRKSTYRIGTDGKKYRITSQRVLDSWSFPFIVEATEEDLKRYPTAVTKLPFRDGSLLNNLADGKLYLVSSGKLRHITNPDFLSALGLKRSDAVLVSKDEVEIMKVGESIN